MTHKEKMRFTVITNHELENKEKEKDKELSKHENYQTNPLREKLVKFVNNDSGHKFSVEDLLRW